MFGVLAAGRKRACGRTGLNGDAPRIASLVPSVTELLCALGLAPWLVARTGFCVHPEKPLASVAKVGGTKDVKLDRLRALAPTHVIVNVDENRLDTLHALHDFVPEVIVTHPCAPADVLGLIDQLRSAFGALPGAAEAALALAGELRAELGHAPAARVAGPVLYLIWRAPWMTVARDTYIARLLAHAGWPTLPALDGGAQGATRYPVITGREPWLADVREVWLSSEPYAFAAPHLHEAQQLCPRARARLVDGQLLSWYGPRTAAGLRYARSLAGAL
jgi:ABC-type Fe3+-hydroxamate transport system substrate-binding protein